MKNTVECLSSTELPQGLTEIPMYCIGSLHNLEKLYIPESVTNIGKVACTFYDTMPTIYYEGTKDDWALITIKAVMLISVNWNLYMNMIIHHRKTRL